jgi:hypothetical protein
MRRYAFIKARLRCLFVVEVEHFDGIDSVFADARHPVEQRLSGLHELDCVVEPRECQQLARAGLRL